MYATGPCTTVSSWLMDTANALSGSTCRRRRDHHQYLYACMQPTTAIASGLPGCADGLRRGTPCQQFLSSKQVIRPYSWSVDLALLSGAVTRFRCGIHKALYLVMLQRSCLQEPKPGPNVPHPRRPCLL